MELGIHDRLILLGLLPEQGDFTTLKIVIDLRSTLSFSEEEHKEFQLKQVVGEDGKGNSVQWLQEAERLKDVAFGDVGRELIVRALKDLDGKKHLTMEHMSLYERFILNPTSPNVGVSGNGVVKEVPVAAS